MQRFQILNPRYKDIEGTINVHDTELNIVLTFAFKYRIAVEFWCNTKCDYNERLRELIESGLYETEHEEEPYNAKKDYSL